MPDDDVDALAAECSVAFGAGDTKGARDLLIKIKGTPARENDPKVLHNAAIAEYVDGGCKEPRKLLGVLESLKQKLEDARAEAEFGEGEALGDADPSLIAYNMAVLYYQLKSYSRCRSLLEDMWGNMEPLDEFLAFKVCFLLLDVVLLQRHAEKANEVLAYLDKSYAALTKPEGSGASKENGEGGGEAAGGGGDGAASEWPSKKSSRRPPTDISPEAVRAAVSTYRAKAALISRGSKASKREVKTTLNACEQNTTGIFLKAGHEWQRQNFKKSIKLLNNSCQKGEKDLAVPALYFNNMGCVHHSLRRHQAAAFYFGRALQENEGLLYSSSAAGGADGIALPQFSCDRRCELEYNRGVQLLLLGRPADAFASLSVALQLYHSHPRCWLRLGECCVAVHLQKQQAFESSKGTKSVSPLVASLAHAGGEAAVASSDSSSRYLVLETEGPPAAGRDGASAAAEEAPPSSDATATAASPAKPEPSLQYGLRCLRNALIHCANQLGSGSQLATIGMAEHQALVTASMSGTLSSTDEHSLQLHSVQRLALLHLSWIALELEDYQPALSWASQLVGLEACPPPLKAYGHLYLCDALCHLNRVDEALEHLTAVLSQSEASSGGGGGGGGGAGGAGPLLQPVASPTGASPSDVESATSPDGEGGVLSIESVRNPYSPFAGAAAAGGAAAGGNGGAAAAAGGGGEGAARATLYTNLAVVHAMQGRTSQARDYCDQALSQQPDNRHAMLCSAYLHLRMGQGSAALDLLKKQRIAKPA